MRRQKKFVLSINIVFAFNHKHDGYLISITFEKELNKRVKRKLYSYAQFVVVANIPEHFALTTNKRRNNSSDQMAVLVILGV